MIKFRYIRTLKAVICLIVAIFLSVAVCLSGCLLDSKSWIINTIRDNYYFIDDFDMEGVEDLTPAEIAKRLDIYSAYYTKEQYEAIERDNAGEKSGIGVSYNFLEGQGIYLVTVIGGSPAYEAGLEAGDIIISGEKDGRTTDFGEANNITAFLADCATGEKFTLNTQTDSYTLSKEVYTASYTFYATNSTAWEFVASGDNSGLALKENKTKARTYLPDGTAYVRLSQFYGTLAAEFGVLMGKFKEAGCTSLILDLRNNGGGYVSSMQDISGYFVSALDTDNKVAMTAEYRNGRKQLYNYYQKTDNLVPKDTHIYALTNSGTASASEALLGVLVSYGVLDYKDIFISDFLDGYLDYVKSASGEAKTAQTYGKGIMQSPFTFITGEVLKLTTAKIFWPNGKCIHGVGLTEADGCTLVKADWSATKNDEELQRAVEIIKAR